MQKRKFDKKRIRLEVLIGHTAWARHNDRKIQIQANEYDNLEPNGCRYNRLMMLDDNDLEFSQFFRTSFDHYIGE